MASHSLATNMINELQLEGGEWSEATDQAADRDLDHSSITTDHEVDRSALTKPCTSINRSQEQILLVVGLGNPVAVDYAAYVQGTEQSGLRVVVADENRTGPIVPPNLDPDISALVIFLNARMTQSESAEFEQILDLARGGAARLVCLVSSFTAHLGDRAAQEIETEALRRVQLPHGRVVIFRAGNILSRHSSVTKSLRRFGFCYPLVPRRLRSCFVGGEELFAAIENERRITLAPGEATARTRSRMYTVLGPKEPWKVLLARHRSPGLWPSFVTVFCRVLSLLFLGSLAGLLIDSLARRRLSLRRWNFDTLRPNSLQELLTLYNRYNYRHVKVVGYNNGVIHFGQKYPGKTVVSTASCNRIRRAGAHLIKTDCGATIRKALDFLAESGQELPVIPNYSYVCLGTAFFVPIHGSASDFSTVADTITRVILYDPVEDRLIAASRDEPNFHEYVYNLKADIMLMRLYLKTKPKSRYFVHRQEVNIPSSRELLDALQDRRATNVEIRKSQGSSDKVAIYKYFKAPEQSSFPVMELPRDKLGRLWDRLEENWVTSFLMHALTRYLGWHVELFFAPGEFPKFWESHRKLPIRKIQLRYIRKDGFPHSPFCESDCVSVDMFMLRWHRLEFERYLKQTFVSVRTNPGKHSG